MATSTSRWGKSARRRSCSWCKSGSVCNSNGKFARISWPCKPRAYPHLVYCFNEILVPVTSRFERLNGQSRHTSAHVSVCEGDKNGRPRSLAHGEDISQSTHKQEIAQRPSRYPQTLEVEAPIQNGYVGKGISTRPAGITKPRMATDPRFLVHFRDEVI